MYKKRQKKGRTEEKKRKGKKDQILRKAPLLLEETEEGRSMDWRERERERVREREK